MLCNVACVLESANMPSGIHFQVTNASMRLVRSVSVWAGVVSLNKYTPQCHCEWKWTIRHKLFAYGSRCAPRCCLPNGCRVGSVAWELGRGWVDRTSFGSRASPCIRAGWQTLRSSKVVERRRTAAARKHHHTHCSNIRNPRLGNKAHLPIWAQGTMIDKQSRHLTCWNIR